MRHWWLVASFRGLGERAGCFNSATLILQLGYLRVAGQVLMGKGLGRWTELGMRK
jgi:hypothetical protein